jgi:TRAP-type mannitol/chloroaromatic compound transport system substrate-binding protein
MSTRRKFIKYGSAAAATAMITGCKKENSVRGTEAKGSFPKQKWTMLTTWPKNFPGLGTGANKLAKYIEELTGGAITVKVYGAGEIVPALEVFDAVQRGTAQIGHGASYYWQGKHPASSFFAAIPFGLNAQEMNAWIYHGGGQELWDKLYEPFGLKAYAAGNTGVQMGGWFNKEIKSVKDFKGLKMRMPGLGGSVLSKLGAAVVTLSGGEIFQSLKTGTIDGSEWVGPYNDMATGLHKAAKFYYWPGWHEPGTSIEALFNKKALESLPSSLQTAVKAACMCANQDMIAEYTLKNAQALKALIEKENVIVKKFPDEVLKKLHEISQEVVKEISTKDHLSKEIYDSFNSVLENSFEWNKVSEMGYSAARGL